MPLRCEKCNNPIAKDGRCTKCDESDGGMGVRAAMDDDANDGIDDRGARARSKGPLMNSAERISKCQKVNIHTQPLPACAPFPSIVSASGGVNVNLLPPMADKGKGGQKGADISWGGERWRRDFGRRSGGSGG